MVHVLFSKPRAVSYGNTDDPQAKCVQKATWIPSSESWWEALYLLFDDPSSSTISFTISAFIFFLILVSSVSFIVATLPAYRFPRYGDTESDSPEVFKWVELGCICIFTIEYFVRFFVAPLVSWELLLEKSEHTHSEEDTFVHWKKLKYFFLKPFNLIDFIAIMPYYFRFFLNKEGTPSFAVLRILRLCRVARVFKLGKHSRDVYIYSKVLENSMGVLSTMFFFSLISAVVFGCLMYYAERGEWSEQHHDYMRNDFYGTGKERSPFQSIPLSMWWVFVTQTTLGYGDMFPTSTVGRCIAIISMNLGILGIALPITVLGQKFADVFAKEEKRKKEEVKLNQSNHKEIDYEEQIEELLQNAENNIREVRRLLRKRRLKKKEKQNVAKEVEQITKVNVNSST